jgi:glutathione S-transferase
VLERLDGHLETQPYVAGAHFTMGDIPVGAVVHRWLALPGVERPPLRALRAWYERHVERAGYRAHVLLPLS